MTASRTTYRADLHVHSSCSDHPTNPGIRALHGRESYTDPLAVYAAAKARGMDYVTITDHNTLDGSLAIAHLPGTFLSCEFDTWFPDGGGRFHVLALGIDEATFAAASRARASIYDLAACLREAGVVHVLAHPLFDMSGTMTPDTVEKLLLLFSALEGLNGSRVSRCNGLLRAIVATLTPERLAAMAARQGIEPYGETPWRKTLIGGSDDHSGLFVAGAHTVAGGDGTVAGFLAAVTGGDCEPAGEDGDARLLAHSIYTASFWRIREILRLDEAAPRKRALKLLRKGFGRIGRDVPLLEKTLRGVRGIAPGLYRDGDGRGLAWEALLEREIGTLIGGRDGLNAVDARELNRRIFTVAQRLADDVVSLHLQPLVDPATRTDVKQRLQAAFAVFMVHFLELPYFISWSFQSRDRTSQRQLRHHFLGGDVAKTKLAVFTDACDPAGDAPLSLTRLAQTAAELGGDLDIITSTPEPSGPQGDARNFRATAWRPPAAGSACGFAVPPIVEILDYLEEHEFTAVHADTAGGMGLLALLAARLLHLPVTGTFGADPARTAERPGRDSLAQRNARRYALWFYGMLDQVLVPSRTSARELVARGLDPERVHVVRRWADAALFAPERRDLTRSRRPA